MEITPLIEAIWKEDDALVRTLARDVGTINDKDSDGRNTLVEAIVKQHNSYVELFVTQGADLVSPDRGGWTPLHFACQEGVVSIVDILLRHRVPVNERNQHGNTPLFVAINNVQRDRSCTLQICRQLIQSGADPMIQNNYGVSPLSLAQDTLKDDELVSILEGG